MIISANLPGAQAQVIPPGQNPGQNKVERDWLFNALRTAPTQTTGDAIADQIWRYWMRQAPDKISSELMNQAMDRRRQYDFAGAMEYLDGLVERSPNWAEAWNQRATILFFQQHYDRSLEDVERVLALEPKHFGALAGKATILMFQGRTELGQKALREAIEVHPWLKERGMLLPVPGQEL